MRVRKHHFVYQLTTLPNVFPVNCYFVEEEQELTLIDAGLPFSFKGMMKAADDIGKPITRIILTHAHEDHVGALDQLKKALPHAHVMISRRDARLMNGDKALEAGEVQLPIRGGVPKSLQTRPDVLLEEGDVIGSLTAVYVPGHTPGSMAFLDMRDRSLIAGDAFQTQGGIAVAGHMKLSFPFPAFGTWSAECAVQSARKLAGLQPSLLATGHGAMLEQPVPAMERAIIAAEQSLERKHGKKTS